MHFNLNISWCTEGISGKFAPQKPSGPLISWTDPVYRLYYSKLFYKSDSDNIAYNTMINQSHFYDKKKTIIKKNSPTRQIQGKGKQTSHFIDKWTNSYLHQIFSRHFCSHGIDNLQWSCPMDMPWRRRIPAFRIAAMLS